jgi:hypothetical protein
MSVTEEDFTSEVNNSVVEQELKIKARTANKRDKVFMEDNGFVIDHTKVVMNL